MKSSTLKRTVYAAACLALAFVLPFLTGQIPEIGNKLSLIHIPVYLCGFLCGPLFGGCVGALAPLLRSLFFGMPPLFPKALAMSAELLTYGLLSGLLDRVLPKKAGYLYVTLIASMIGGRLVWGAARYLFAGLSGSRFPFSAFLAGAVTEAIPGIILQIALIPILVLAVRRTVEKGQNTLKK